MIILVQEMPLSGQILIVAGSTIILYIVYQIIYNIWFHPLSKYPGPKLWAASRIPYNWHTIRGTSATNFRALHEKYGETVRYSPDALSYTSPRAWDEVYGPFKDKGFMDMDPEIFGGGAGPTTENILMFATGEKRSRLRTHLMRALSTKAVASQEPIIQHYAQQFVEAINKQLDGKPGVIDIAHWFSIATFDIISDLAFGKSFAGLEKGSLHPWIRIVLGIFSWAPRLRVLREIPGVKSLRMPQCVKKLFPLIPRMLLRTWMEHLNYGAHLIDARIKSRVCRPDFIHYFMSDKDDMPLSVNEIKENAVMLVTAGSEPTATFKAGVCYFLGQNPVVYQKLKKEIRGMFSDGAPMTFSRLAQLEYLNLVIREGLRMFPPAADIFPRIVPSGGEFVMSDFLPEGTHVSICALAASYSAQNFANPNIFDPERWTEERSVGNEGMKASQPFGQGHRSCIGRNLALAEIRLLLASFVFNFDMEVLPEDRNWLERCRVFIGWEKRPLRALVIPVNIGR